MLQIDGRNMFRGDVRPYEITRIGNFVYMETVSCRKCESLSCVKAGFSRGKQRYKCKECSSRFIPFGVRERNLRFDIVELYLEGVCIRSIGRLIGMSHVGVLKLIKRESFRLKPLIPLYAKDIEIDELYLYIKNKKKKRWLWLAICKESKRILGFQVGGRGGKTLENLYHKIEPIACERYYTDDHAPYKSILPKEKHSIYLGATNTIEGINSAIRHYLSRFRRRSKCYGKSISMVEVSMSLLMYKFNRNYEIRKAA